MKTETDIGYDADLSEDASGKKFRPYLFEYPKEYFSPESTYHLAAYRDFLKNRGWGASGCPFLLDSNYETIPGMIQDKILKHWIDKLVNIASKKRREPL